MSLVWINGQLVDKSEAKISVFDHGFLYSDGAWEHFRAFNGRVFRHEKPFERLYESADALGIQIPMTWSELLSSINSTLEANNRTDGYIRVIVTRGPGS